MSDSTVALSPQQGSQLAFVTCPVREVLYEGTRGPGKTLALLMDFMQHVGCGFGAHWRGILFRETYPQLADVIAKTEEWIPQIFPDAVYNKADHVWKFKTGETLSFRHMSNPKDYSKINQGRKPSTQEEDITMIKQLEERLELISAELKTSKKRKNMFRAKMEQ